MSATTGALRSRSKRHAARQCKACGYKAVSAARSTLDLVGQHIGSFTIISKAVVPRGRKSQWVCRCLCGVTCNVYTSSLRKKGAKPACWDCGRKATGLKKRRQIAGEIPSRYWQAVVSGAELRGLTVEVSPAEAWALFERQKRLCRFTGVPLAFRSNGRMNTASLDRIDSSVVYHSDNIQWVHKDINRLKMDQSDKDFIDICTKIAVWSGGRVAF